MTNEEKRALTVSCANCGDTPNFSVPNDSKWFCTEECYEEYYENLTPEMLIAEGVVKIKE